MLITFRCPCSRKLVVKQEYIGKRATCPECGVKSVVPERSTEPAARPARVAEPAPEVRTQLTPRKRPMADPDEAPRRKPIAEEEAPRKRRPVADEDEAPRKRPVMAVTDAPRKRVAPVAPLDDEEDDDDPRPARRSKKSRKGDTGSNLTLILILVFAFAGLLVLGSGGFAIWYFGFRSSGKSAEQASSSSSGSKTERASPPAVIIDEDVKRIPDDAIAFGTCNVADFWGTDNAQKILQQLQPLQPVENITKAIGVGPADIRRVTFAVGNDPEKQICILISTRKPFQPDVVSRALVPSGNKVPYQGKSYLKEKDTALYIFPDNQSFVIGPVEGVHWMLTATPMSDKNPIGQARSKASKNLLVVAVNLDASKIRQGLQNAPPDLSSKAGNLLKARTAVLTWDFKSDSRLHLDLKMPDDKVASAALAEANELKKMGIQQIATMKQQAPPQMRQTTDPAYTEMESAVQSIKLTQAGDTVSLDLVTDTSTKAFQGLLAGQIPFPGNNVPQPPQPPPGRGARPPQTPPPPPPRQPRP
jgi:hypothetical protein